MKARWITIVVEDSVVAYVAPYKSLSQAKDTADVMVERLVPQTDRAVVWDLELNRVIYDPIHGVDEYPGA